MIDRRAELAANLADVRGRLDAACAAAGRGSDEVSLVVVTKTWPAADAIMLAELGVTDVAENRDQEAGPKQRDCEGAGLRWHFIGQLQRNKAKSVARYAAVVESLDRPGLIGALAAARESVSEAQPLDVLIQVSLDEPVLDGRGGAAPEDVLALAELVTQHSSLRLGGVMAVAPLGADPDRAFERLRHISEQLRQAHPHAVVISAGMSGDLEAAVRQGTTQVRVGTAVLGHRPPVR